MIDFIPIWGICATALFIGVCLIMIHNDNSRWRH